MNLGIEPIYYFVIYLQGYIFLPIRGQMGRGKKSAFEKEGKKKETFETLKMGNKNLDSSPFFYRKVFFPIFSIKMGNKNLDPSPFFH